MDFSIRLNELMNLTGITNSKLARHLRVDPSLVSRWRNGTRKPTKDQEVVQKIAAYLVSHATTRYHLKEIATLLDRPSIMHTKESDVVEQVFLWLQSFDDKPAGNPEPRRTTTKRHSSPETTDTYAGIAGRSLVLKKLLENYDPDAVGTPVYYYSNDPGDLVKQDTELIEAALKENPHLLDNIGEVKLIINDSATSKEIESYITFLLPFLVNGRLSIAQSSHYRKEAFSNSVFILGNNLAAASHGFADGNTYVTNLFTDSDFISQLIDDFLNVYNQATKLHTTDWDIDFFEVLDDSLKLWILDKPVSYVSNALPICSANPDIVTALARKAGIIGADDDADEIGAIRDYIIRYEQFLEKQKNYLLMPLYSLEEVRTGAAKMAALPRFAGDDPLIDEDTYIAILKQILERLHKYENLVFKAIPEVKHEYSLRIQSGSHSSIVKNTKPYANYVSVAPVFAYGFTAFINSAYGGSEALLAQRDENIQALERHIATLEKELTQTKTPVEA